MKSKILKIIAVIILGVIGYVAYLWFMPHRNIQATKAYATIDATALVNEFLADAQKANDLYLDTEGESKVLIITGTVASISKDQLGQQVILLKKPTDKMGVSCTFTLESNSQAEGLKIGDQVNIKGVIRSGAEYDEDLDLAENVIVEKSAIVQ
ncbi:MAG TPA: hypothetical protein ENK46_12970 [Flavobacteriia bacterium]|nr:hypothetical protein [Flavobacteriia bacterium]